MGSGFSKQKKQMRQMQDQFAKMQEEMENTIVEGSAGNGLITVKLNGSKILKEIVIKSECVDPEDVEGLQDLIQAAFEDATKKLEEKEEGFSLPAGMNLPF